MRLHTGAKVVHWCVGVGMVVCHVVSSLMYLLVDTQRSLSGSKTSSLCCRDKVQSSVRNGVQLCEIWSTEEEVHMRPGHQWFCEFGDSGDGTSCEKEFNIPHHTWEDYSGTRYNNGDRALVINR